MHCLQIAALTFLLATATYADLYFSDCAGDGGVGTQADPFCLDPDNDGNNETFFRAWDNSDTFGVTDVAAGDTIFLCCGSPCTTAVNPTCTFPIDDFATHPTVNWPLSPQINVGVSGMPITIKPLDGHNVIISGDSNQNGVWDSGEPEGLITTNDSSDSSAIEVYWIEWLGTWDDGSDKHLIFEKFASNNDGEFDLKDPRGWVFDGIIIRGFGDKMWELNKAATNPTNVSHVYWSEQAGGDGGKVFRVIGLNTEQFRVSNSLVHHVTGKIFRVINNNGFGGGNDGTVLVEKNEFYNCGTLTDNFQNYDYDTANGISSTYRGNYVHDCDKGIGSEDHIRALTIEDNVIECRGEWQTRANGTCGLGLIRATHNRSGQNRDDSSGFTIRRNIISARNIEQTGSTKDCRTAPETCGAASTAGISIDVTCGNHTGSDCTGVALSSLIENNIIMGLHSTSASDESRACIYVQTDDDQTGLFTIRNNTCWNTDLGITLESFSGVVAYDVQNNLVGRTNDDGTASGTPDFALKECSNCTTGDRLNNNFDLGGLGSGATNVVSSGGSTTDCTNIGTFGTDNICATSNFRRTSGESSAWNLLLFACASNRDTNNRDAGKTVGGATEDILGLSRPVGTTDIGAHEMRIKSQGCGRFL